ncbi:MAG: hypothetical protein JEY71_03395 [Sphaerochaeta sp.]|nr:hypothetical protein [Sphaerochaeta sp.]
MNKTWSIILIVVACIVVLGGTYWYFGMQKPITQKETTPPTVVEPVKVQPPTTKDSPVVSADTKEDLPLAKQIVDTKEVSVADPSTAKPAEEIQKGTLPAEPSKQLKQIPAPIAPTISKGGGFFLPTLGPQSMEAVAETGTTTSVLASEKLPAKAEVSNLSTKEVKVEEVVEVAAGNIVVDEVKEPKPILEVSEVQIELPDSSEQEGKVPETIQEKAPEEEKLSPVAQEEPVVSQPEEAQSVPPTVVVTPPVVKILRSETTLAEEKPADEKPALEASLSVSFLDYNFTNDFSSTQKGFNVSLDVMSQKEVFGWGGTLEVGKPSSLDIVQISLLGKATWSLGKDVVTFPLSISLGPTLFIDTTASTTGFGMKAKLSAGVTYAISESFRMFYAVGVGATYNFQDSSSFRFVLEPLRIGVGFSF